MCDIVISPIFVAGYYSVARTEIGPVGIVPWIFSLVQIVPIVKNCQYSGIFVKFVPQKCVTFILYLKWFDEVQKNANHILRIYWELLRLALDNEDRSFK